MSFFEYVPIEDAEPVSGYGPGGYHPVIAGDRLHDRYLVVHKLGYGTFSTVWLAHDQQTQQYVAVKVGISHDPSGGDDIPRREIETLTCLAEGINASSQPMAGAAMVPLIKDHFTVNGPNGDHPCLVMSPTRCSLSTSRLVCLRPFQLDVARSLAAQLILAVCFVHSQGYCHGDLHLGNLLLQLPFSLDGLTVDELYSKFGSPESEPVIRTDGRPYSVKPGVPPHIYEEMWLGKNAVDLVLDEAKLVLSDFGTAFRPSDNKQNMSYTPLVYRPPESLLDPDTPLSFGSDIWSLGCAIFELFAHNSLICGVLGTKNRTTTQHILLLGPMPEAWWHRWQSNGGSLDPGYDEPISFEGRFEEAVQKVRRDYGFPTVSDQEKSELLELLQRMITWKPSDRPSAEQLLEMDWVKNWALPAFEAGRKNRTTVTEAF